MTLILPRRSLLSYPAGTAPGFDPSHPAAKGIVRFSGTAQNGGFINRLSGVVGTNANGPTCSIDGRLGESTGYAVAVSAAVATSWTGQATDTDNNATIAAIVQWNSLNSFNALFSNSSGAGAQFALFSQTTFLMMRHGTTNSVSTLGLVTGVPYFVAGSANGGASGSINYLVKRLDTGAVTFVNQAGSIAATGSTGTYYVGNWGGLSLPADGIISAVAYSNAFLSLSELVAWSNDPWSFWYPAAPPAQRKVSYSYSYGPAAAPVTTTAGARVRQWFNRSKLAYPAGSAAGFDPSHPASCGLAGNHGFSAVAMGGGFVNLVTSSPGINTAGFTSGTLTTRGPNLRITSTFSNYNWPSINIADTVGTFAAIYTVDSGADGGNILTSDALGNFGMSLRNTQFVMAGVAGVPHGLTMLTNTPMFLVASKGPAFVNFVMVNLATGKVVSSAVADASTPGVPGGAPPRQGIGGQGTAGTIVGNVAAGMWAPVYLSMPQLLQWAQDPWSFWYPNKMIELTDGGVTPITPTVALYELMMIW